MKSKIRLFALALLLCSCLVMLPTAAHAADVSLDGAPLVKASLVSDTTAIAPGSQFTLGIHLKMKSHWHTYWINPGESGEATKIKLTGPAGFSFGKVQWPLPRAIESFGAITYGYEDEVMLLVPVSVAKDVKLEGKATINAHVVWLACHETCIEGEAKLSISLPVGGEMEAANQKQFDHWRKQIPLASTSVIESIEQGKNGKGPLPMLTVAWSEEPRKVEWFPVSTPAVAIESVVIKHEGKKSVISYKPTVYKPEQLVGGIVEGVVVYEDAKGQRKGVAMTFKVVTGE